MHIFDKQIQLLNNMFRVDRTHQEEILLEETYFIRLHLQHPYLFQSTSRVSDKTVLEFLDLPMLERVFPWVTRHY